MHVSADIKKRVEAKLNECIDTIKAKFGVEVRYPTVRFDVRGTTAGYANYREWYVRFNPILLNENVDEFIARTVPHELAHLATELIYPHAHRRTYGTKRSPHGAEWQSIMIALGANPTRCHQYDVSNAAVRKSTSVAYVCNCCHKEYSIGPKRHAKLQRNPSAYWCKCSRGSKLQLKESTTQAKAAPVVSKPVVTTTGKSKLDVCKGIYAVYSYKTRAEVIKLFVEMAGCTPAGASTYYATCKKG